MINIKLPAELFLILWFNFILEINAVQETSDIIWKDTQHQVLFSLAGQVREFPFDPETSRGSTFMPSITSSSIKPTCKPR